MSDRLPRLADFPFQSYDKIRYGDTDRQGHVNNAVFATFIETGRTDFLYAPDQPLGDEGSSWVIAKLDLDFLGEVTWPGRVEIGTGVTKVGRSSLHMRQAIFQHDRCVATATVVIVQMDDQTRKSRPLSDKTAAFLRQHIVTT